MPLAGGQSRSPYARVDGNPPPVNQRPLGLTRSISPGFLKTFGIPLLAGRDIDERDGVDKPLVVLVSKSTAQKLFPGGEDPIGKRVFFGTDNNTGLPGGNYRRRRRCPLDRSSIGRTTSSFTGPGRNARSRSLA